MKMDVDDSCGIKIKEEAKECLSPTSTTAHAPSVTGTTNNVPTTTTTTTTSKLTTTNNNPEPSPVNLNLKPRNKGSSQPLKERLDEAPPLQSTPGPEARPTSPIVQIRASTQSSGAPRSTGIHDQVCRTGAGSRSSDSDSPLPQSAKIENGESIVGRLLTVNVTVHDDTSTGSASRTPHAKLKRLLGTLVQFANDISTETGDTVRNLVFSLLSGAMTAEEFHRALQDATNFPLRGFVLPYLKHTLPSLQRDLTNAARANKQTSAQYLRSNKSAVLEAAGFSPGEAAEVFGERNNASTVSGSIFPQYTIGTTVSNSNNGTNSGSNNVTAGPAPGVHGNQHHNSSSIHHYPGPPPPPHSLKRRASDTPYYESGAGGPLFEDGPLYGKRSMNPWPSHHPLHHQRQQQQHQPHQAPDAYCWYHPLHLSCGSQTSLQNHPQSSMPPSLVQINPLASSASSISSAIHLAHQQPRVSSQQNESCPAGSNIALDDEWKNIHVMLDCILGMVEKTKTALAILQRRGCPSPAIPVTAVATSGTSSLNNGPVPTTGAQPDPTASDRDNSLKRITGEIFAQTIKAAEDRVAEVQRRAEEEMLEAKRAAVAEVQRAITAAAAESREVERLRVHHRFFEPQMQRNHGHSLAHGIGHGPLLRVVEVTTCSPTAGTTTSTTTTASNLSGGRDEDKESLPLLGSSCWNCRRQALETCGGCGIARYCGSFCQHRDWEAGGHHASCNPRRSPPPPPPLPPPPPPRPTSRSPTASSAAVAAPGTGAGSSATAAPSSATGHAAKER